MTRFLFLHSLDPILQHWSTTKLQHLWRNPLTTALSPLSMHCTNSDHLHCCIVSIKLMHSLNSPMACTYFCPCLHAERWVGQLRQRLESCAFSTPCAAAPPALSSFHFDAHWMDGHWTTGHALSLFWDRVGAKIGILRIFPCLLFSYM